MDKTNIIFNKGEIVENKYEIQFLLQSYTTSQVYRVRDYNGKLFRLKVFNSAKLKREHFHSNGELTEINILKSLDHPNIINLQDFGDFNYKLNQYYFLATEFLSGESLQERLKRENPLSVYAAIPIVIELLQALYYLHRRSDPIIYNGLTLNNVFLDYREKRERVILTNFHNARYFNSKIKSFELEDLQPFFMAPETFNNIITPSTDLFSAGALLYNLVTGIPPWYVEFSHQQMNTKEMVDKIFEARKKPLKVSENDKIIMDSDIINIIKKSLALDIEKRFDSSNEFIKALKREIVVETYDSINGKKSGLLKEMK